MAGATLSFGQVKRPQQPKPVLPKPNKPPPAATPVITAPKTTGAGLTTPSQPAVGPQPGGVTSTPTTGGGRIISGTIGTPTKGPKPVGATLTTTSQPGFPKPPVTPGAPPSGTPTGAPDPGTPDTSFPIQLDPTDELNRQGALTDYGNAYASAFGGLQGAAEQYGDPTILANLGLSATPNPNSALAQAALAAQQATHSNQDAMEGNNTVFSSVNQYNQQQIEQARQKAIGDAYDAYQNALRAFNTAVSGAASSRDKITGAADIDERTKTLANLPTKGNPAAPPKGKTKTTTKGKGPIPTGPPKSEGKTSRRGRK